MLASQALQQQDPAIYELIQKEAHRQHQHLELIASENFVSIPVMEAMGTVLTNKYAEGVPGKRYYGGCEFVDQIEQIAIDRLKQLFGCFHANVQPHSGAQANMAAFMAAGLQPGDTIMGQDLSHGGHLTHGSPVNFSGLWYKVASYGVNVETGRLEMEQVRQAALQHRPKMILAGTSAYSRVLDFAAFRSIADEIGAVLVADIAHIAGLVAAGVHPSPVGQAQIVTSTTHKTLRGPRGGIIMADEAYAKAIDKSVFPGLQGGPLEHVIAAKAVAFKEALTPEFATYARQIVANARALANALIENGLTIVSGGTDTHLMMVDLRSVGMTGKAASNVLEAIHVTANKNTIPNDPESPFVTSGIRLGTPALTTRGMREAEMVDIAGIIADALKSVDSVDNLKARVATLADRFPLYPELQTISQKQADACSISV